MSIPFVLNVNKLTLADASTPAILRRIASPPKQLFVAGTPLDELMRRLRVATVGSRNISAFGREATTKLVRELASRGIVISSWHDGNMQERWWHEHARLETMKLMIWLGIIVGGAIGNLLGMPLDHGLGAWSILFSTIGSLAGVWAGYKLGKLYF